jgi:hypothetical protein
MNDLQNSLISSSPMYVWMYISFLLCGLTLKNKSNNTWSTAYNIALEKVSNKYIICNIMFIGISQASFYNFGKYPSEKPSIIIFLCGLLFLSTSTWVGIKFIISNGKSFKNDSK